MQFASQDLTNQFISTSYQEVIQTYINGSSSYFLDGLGNVISFIPTSSVGNQILTIDQTASYASTSSWATNVVNGSTFNGTSSIFGTASWANNSKTASYVTSSNIIGTVKSASILEDTVNNIVSANGTTRLLYDNSNQNSVDWQNKVLWGLGKVDYQNCALYREDQSTITVNWNSLLLNDYGGNTSINWQNRFLYDSTGTINSVDWNNRLLADNTEIYSIDWQNRFLYDSTGTINSVDWNNRLLVDNSGNTSIDWQNRVLSGSWTISIFSVAGTQQLTDGLGDGWGFSVPSTTNNPPSYVRVVLQCINDEEPDFSLNDELDIACVMNSSTTGLAEFRVQSSTGNIRVDYHGDPGSNVIAESVTISSFSNFNIKVYYAL